MVPTHSLHAVPGRRSWLLPLIVVPVALLSMWYGQAPPRSASAYAAQAGATAGLLHSQLETAQLWAAQRAQGRVTDAATLVALEESEEDAQVTLARFAGYQPPSGSDSVRGQLVAQGSRVVETLAAMRIAARRGDWSAVSRAGGAGATLSDELATLEKRLSR